MKNGILYIPNNIYSLLLNLWQYLSRTWYFHFMNISLFVSILLPLCNLFLPFLMSCRTVMSLLYLNHCLCLKTASPPSACFFIIFHLFFLSFQLNYTFPFFYPSFLFVLDICFSFLLVLVLFVLVGCQQLSDQ